MYISCESLLGLLCIVVSVLRRYYAHSLCFQVVIFVEEHLCVLSKGKSTVWWNQLKQKSNIMKEMNRGKF